MQSPAVSQAWLKSLAVIDVGVSGEPLDVDELVELVELDELEVPDDPDDDEERMPLDPPEVV